MLYLLQIYVIHIIKIHTLDYGLVNIKSTFDLCALQINSTFDFFIKYLSDTDIGIINIKT